MVSKRVIRWVGASLVALLVFGVVAGACGSSGGNSASSSSTTPSGSSDTVVRDGDPQFCAAIVDFQNAYVVVGEPAATATPADVEAGWNDLSDASGRMVQLAPQEMVGFVSPVVSAFDTLRQDADAVGYDYTNFDDLASSATIDPQGDIAQSAYALFTYGADRCPVDTTATTVAPATTATTVAPG